MNAPRAEGSKPGRPALDQEKLSAALMLVKGGMSPTQAARQTGLGRSIVYWENQRRPNA
jgi:DNA invertase Pin-like site-specific DNA recombinase